MNTELTDRIIAAYKEHYSFPPQGESHMHDCIMDVLGPDVVPSDEPITLGSPADHVWRSGYEAALQAKETDRQHHMDAINRLAAQIGMLGHTSDEVIALAMQMIAERGGDSTLYESCRSD